MGVTECSEVGIISPTISFKAIITLVGSTKTILVSKQI